MIHDLFAILWAPFLMCLVLTGIHAYLGVHVLAREVVFVDIAMAQIAALGATAAFLLGYDTETWQSYAYALAATIVGAVVLALTPEPAPARLAGGGDRRGVRGLLGRRRAGGRSRRARRRAGARHARRQPAGGGAPDEVAKVAGLYAMVGVLHWLCRRPFFLISTDPDRRLCARGGGCGSGTLCSTRRSASWWPARSAIAGVLLVFSYLIVPALAGVTLGGSVLRPPADRLGLRRAGQRPRQWWPPPRSTCPPGATDRLRLRRDPARLRPGVSLRPRRPAQSAAVSVRRRCA